MCVLEYICVCFVLVCIGSVAVHTYFYYLHIKHYCLSNVISKNVFCMQMFVRACVYVCMWCEFVCVCACVCVCVRDKEKWWDANMAAMEEDLRRCRQGDFFKKLKRLSGSKSRPVDTILDEVGQPLQSNEDKLARWRRHFQDVLNVENAVAAEVMTEVEDNGDTDTPEVTREVVMKAVMRLQNGKAAGEDRIVAELLKSGGDSVIDWLTELIQEVWRTRKVPQDWRNATLIPLFKKKDRTQCNNYRGISLLSVPGKVLTLILLEWLHPIIDPQLMETQCGFRKGRGTVDQIWVVRQVVESNRIQDTGIHVLCGSHKGVRLSQPSSHGSHPEGVWGAPPVSSHH